MYQQIADLAGGDIASILQVRDGFGFGDASIARGPHTLPRWHFPILQCLPALVHAPSPKTNDRSVIRGSQTLLAPSHPTREAVPIRDVLSHCFDGHNACPRIYAGFHEVRKSVSFESPDKHPAAGLLKGELGSGKPRTNEMMDASIISLERSDVRDTNASSTGVPPLS